jgi:hypothetical protein
VVGSPASGRAPRCLEPVLHLRACGLRLDLELPTVSCARILLQGYFHHVAHGERNFASVVTSVDLHGFGVLRVRRTTETQSDEETPNRSVYTRHIDLRTSNDAYSDTGFGQVQGSKPVARTPAFGVRGSYRPLRSIHHDMRPFLRFEVRVDCAEQSSAFPQPQSCALRNPAGACVRP